MVLPVAAAAAQVHRAARLPVLSQLAKAAIARSVIATDMISESGARLSAIRWEKNTLSVRASNVVMRLRNSSRVSQAPASAATRPNEQVTNRGVRKRSG